MNPEISIHNEDDPINLAFIHYQTNVTEDPQKVTEISAQYSAHIGMPYKEFIKWCEQSADSSVEEQSGELFNEFYLWYFNTHMHS